MTGLRPLVARLLAPQRPRPATVQHVVPVGPRLRQVRFSGPALQGLRFRPGQEVGFRLRGGAVQHDAPMAYEPRTGVLDVLFHAPGPGAHWTTSLDVGDQVDVTAPGGRYRLRPSDAHVFLGDESSVGLFHALARSEPTPRIFGAVEFDESDAADAARPFVEDTVERLVRWGQPGDVLLDWVETVDPRPRGLTTTFYLAGDPQTVRRLEVALRGRGWSRTAVRSKPRWADA